MIRVMIVEDEEQIGRILKKMIEKNQEFQVVSLCDSFSAAITEFISQRPDVVFMDIDLKGESGLDCAKAICETEPKVKIVFATAHSEYMADAFEIYAFDYLVKPFDMERLSKTLTRLQTISDGDKEKRKSQSAEEKLMIRGKEEIDFIDVNDIIMIERADGVTRIVTLSDTYITSSPLNVLEKKLDTDAFLRCHKSYIIRMDAVKKLKVYGRWTYTVYLKGTNETALMTAGKYEKIKERFG